MWRLAPVILLALLSPLLAEVCFGATPLSNLGGLVLVAPMYGAGAVLIREVVRRRGAGWGAIVLLGTAYGIVEEGLAIRSLFDAELFHAGVLGARTWGINGVWTQWTIGYHVVWSIGTPILLTETLFPARRGENWLKGWEVAVAGGVFALASTGLGLVFRKVIRPDFAAPPLQFWTVAATAVVLAAAALTWPRSGAATARPEAGRVGPPWLVGLAVLSGAAIHFWLLLLPIAVRSSRGVVVPMAADAVVAAGIGFWLRRMSRFKDWSDRHRLSVVLGVLPPSMLYGFLVVTAEIRTDQAFQALVCAATLIWLAVICRRLPRPAEESPTG